jgi:hypothetical protein
VGLLTGEPTAEIANAGGYSENAVPDRDGAKL